MAVCIAKKPSCHLMSVSRLFSVHKVRGFAILS